MELSFKVERINVLPEPKNNTLAFADLLVNDALVIRGLRVCNGKNGRFVSFPQDIGKDEKWYDQVYLKDKKLNAVVSEVVLKAFEEKKPKND